MSEEIQRIKEHINSNEFLYIIGVDIIISGCKLNFKVKDTQLLKSISNDECTITSICFQTLKSEKSVFKCKIVTKDLLKAYNFINFKLKPIVIKTFLITENVKDLYIENNINCVIENEQEAIEKGITIIPYGSKYLNLLIKNFNIKENEFEISMRKVIESNYKFDNVLFWMYTSYSVANIVEGKTKFDYISQYSLLWTAFNALYSKIYPKFGDRQSVEKFATINYVVDYFKELFISHDTYELLEKLSSKNLILRNDNNVSKKLKESLKQKDNNGISVNTMLCLYAVRNDIIHGSAVEEIELCITAFDILNPLIKLSIINEMSC